MVEDGRFVVRKRLFDTAIRRGEAELKHLEKMNQNAPEANRTFLMNCIRANADTEFGKRFGFDGIRSYEEYVRQVPVCDWSVLGPYADRMAENGEQGLLCSDPVLFIYSTSGTTGREKRIPWTRKAMEIQNRYLVNAMFGTVAREEGDIWSGGGILLLNEATVRRTKSGLPLSCISSGTIVSNRELAPLLYASPPEVIMPEEGTDTIALHARFALENSRIGDIQSSYGIMPLELMHYVVEHWENLARQIEEGTLDESIRMPESVRASLRKRLCPHPERARELREIFRSGSGEPLMPRIWPNLRVISIGTAADFGMYEKQLRRYSGDNVRFFHRGYTASEGVFTIPEGLDDREGVLLADSVFYEFRLEDGRIMTMDQLEKGMICSLLVTTQSGLYRYPMEDRTKVTGFSHTCPRLKLLGRGDQTLNLFTEKLYMPLVNECVEKACREAGGELRYYAVLPDREAVPLPRYVFYIETAGNPDMKMLRQALTAELCGISVNLASKLKTRKLELPEVRRLRTGTWESYMLPLQEKAAAEGKQVKPVCLLKDRKEADFFQKHTIDGGDMSEGY